MMGSLSPRAGQQFQNSLKEQLRSADGLSSRSDAIPTFRNSFRVTDFRSTNTIVRIWRTYGLCRWWWARRLGPRPNESERRPATDTAIHNGSSSEENLAQEIATVCEPVESIDTAQPIDYSPHRRRRRIVLARRGSPRDIRILQKYGTGSRGVDHAERLSNSSPLRRLAGCGRSTILRGTWNIRPLNGRPRAGSRRGCGKRRGGRAFVDLAAPRPRCSAEAGEPVAFRGHSLTSTDSISIRAVLKYLDEVDPTTARVARKDTAVYDAVAVRILPTLATPPRGCLSNLRIGSCSGADQSLAQRRAYASMMANGSWMMCRIRGWLQMPAILSDHVLRLARIIEFAQSPHV